MPRNTMYALLLIAALVVVFLFNRGDVDINLVVTELTLMKPLALLLFTGLGVLVGVLIK